MSIRKIGCFFYVIINIYWKKINIFHILILTVVNMSVIIKVSKGGVNEHGNR